MPFVIRDGDGEITGVLETAGRGSADEVAASDPALRRFMARLEAADDSIESTDVGFIRVIEDVLDLLIADKVIRFEDLPPDAQTKIARRKQLRDQSRG